MDRIESFESSNTTQNIMTTLMFIMMSTVDPPFMFGDHSSIVVNAGTAWQT